MRILPNNAQILERLPGLAQLALLSSAGDA